MGKFFPSWKVTILQNLHKVKKLIWPEYNTKDEEIVAYDYDTNLKHSSYVNVSKAAEMLGIMKRLLGV